MGKMGVHEFGWIQNPTNFGKLKRTVSILIHGSKYHTFLLDSGLDYVQDIKVRDQLRTGLESNPVKITYEQMKGKATFPNNYIGKHARANQVPVGLAQISGGDNKKAKAWTDEWTSEGFLNWALTLHFFEVDEKTDLLSITTLGENFVNTVDGVWKSKSNEKTYQLSDEEKAFLIPVVMAYPPAVRFLQLLKDNNAISSKGDTAVLSKFKIGHELGFAGEPGFTSMNEDDWFEYLHASPASEKNKVRSNIEGSADKWTRTISSWLSSLNLIKQKKLVRIVGGIEEYTPHAYQLNGLKGERALKSATGNSSNSAIQKFISWHMLATKVTNKNYIKLRRAYTIKAIQKFTTIKAVSDDLKNYGLFNGEGVLKADLRGLIRFGLRLKYDNKKVVFQDRINNFKLPQLNITKQLMDQHLENIKNKLLNTLTEIDPSDIELVEMAWGKSATRSQNTVDATLFESKTVEIFKKYFKLEGEHLGHANKPDGVVYYDNTFGILLDTKAYSNGYNIPISQQREMVDYINDVINKDETVTPNKWWEAFPEKLPVAQTYYLWVAGAFTGKYDMALKKTYNQTGMWGGAMDTQTLLRLANEVSLGTRSVTSIPSLLTNQLVK